MERMKGCAGCFFETGFVWDRIKGFKEIQDEQPIQTGINLIYVIECDLLRLPLRCVSSRTSYLRRSVSVLHIIQSRCKKGTLERIENKGLKVSRDLDVFDLWD